MQTDLTLEIRLIEEGDIPSISELILTNFRSDYFSDYPENVLRTYLIPNTPERLHGIMLREDTTVYIAELNNEIIGVLMLRYDKIKQGYKIKRFHISHDYIGQHYGDILLEQAYDFVRSKGEDTIHIEAPPKTKDYFLVHGWEGECVDKEVTINLGQMVIRETVKRFVAYKKL